MNNIRDWNIYLVTDRNLSLGRSLSQICVAAIKGGVSVIQIREKSIDSRTFFQEAMAVRDLMRNSRIPLIINDRIDIALAVEADGVHLGQSDIPLREARDILGPDRIIGWSVESPEDIRSQEASIADYLAVGPIFFTSTKSDISQPWGIEGMRSARSITDKPLVAIGGLSESNIRDVVDAGADCVALVSAIVSAHDVKSATEMLSKLVLESKLVRDGQSRS